VGTLEVDGKDGDIVEVNGVVRASLPAVTGIRAAMGKTRVRVSRGEDVVYDDTLDIPGGKIVHINVVDSFEDPAVSGPKSHPQAEESVEPGVAQEDTASAKAAPEKKKRLWTWVAFGVGGAAGIAGAALGGVALAKKNDFISDCGEGDCTEAREGDQDSVNNLAVAADVMYGVAAVGVMTGLILFFLEPRFGKKRETAVMPAFTGDFVGIQAAGRF
jgi:hypothetical protein